MYLKQLDIQGFKSFPEKVKLEFNKGITAVVGPNGSGKSNVSDAVRWVLGEQRAKSLRGEKMEDVIFAGTQSRKALGFAEVSVTIDNQDHKMPIEYTEVKVSRRVFRSGESEYQINGVGCRLKDIHELFMDTGVGREGYSIIGQGRIDEILSQKGEDRRRIFEEAAGIVKYKTRKMEAVQKLEREQQNLQRVEDIIAELEGQLEPLQKQSEQAKSYLALRETLKETELSLFCIEVDRLEAEEASLTHKQDVLKGALQQLDEEGQRNKAEQTSLLENTDSLTVEIQSINDQIVELRAGLEKKEGEIRLAEEQIQNGLKGIDRITLENSQREQTQQKNLEEIQLLDTKITAGDMKMQMEKQKLSQAEGSLAALSATLTENESMADAYQTEIVEQIKMSTQARGDIGKREVMASQLEKRKEQLTAEKSYLLSQIHDHQTHLQAIEKQFSDMVAHEKDLKTATELAGQKSASVREMANQLSSEIVIKERNVNEKKSRLKILSDMEREHDGYFKSVKSILQLKNGENPKWQGICGAVGELLHVEERFETAIEAALGGAVQNIITNTEEDAKEAIAYLKQNHLGRATFLPISAVKAKGLGRDAQTLFSEKGVIGTADTLVEFSEDYAGVVSSLLGRTLVLDTLDNAVALAKKYRHQYKLVTLDGDILNPGGAMTGGSVSKKNANIFGRSREIKELTAKLQEAVVSLTKQKETWQQYQQDLEMLDQEIVEQRMQKQKLELSRQAVEQDREKTEMLLLEQQKKLSLYEVEEGQLQKQQEHTQKDLETYRQKLLQAEKAMEELNSKLSGFQHSMESEKAHREKLLSEITELKVAVSSMEQQRVGYLDAKRRIIAENDRLAETIIQAKGEIKQLHEQTHQKRIEITQIEQAVAALRENEQQRQQGLVNVVDKRKVLQEDLGNLQQKAQSLTEDTAKLQNDVYRVETKMEKAAEEKQRYYDQMWEDYQCTYQMAKHAGNQNLSYSALKQEARQCREQIKALGNVNVGAIEQYKEVSQRFDFLTAQKADILEAEEKLQTIIVELSQRMEDRFREQLELISQNFNEVFQEMFGGGKAYLKLTDESQILDSPIEIIAQPPGKSLQNMLLLSGGERALTAIAILFSILKMKPSPFCILDEIEAALDDANVKRYAKYLTKFSGDTQFIVITHRKGTMEAADVLYGVTMQEKGVSKLISVDFTEQQYA